MKTLITIFLSILLIQNNINSQQNADTIKAALLIVDIQNFYFPGAGPGLVNALPASENAKEVLKIFRDNKQLVIHVRHKTNKGFEIHKNVEPLADEKVITKEEVNSFQNTDLLEYLKSNKINRLILIGMQTHMCLEAAVRAGHDFGFECVVVQDACATKDLKFGDRVVKAEDVHASTLSTLVVGGYAKVIDLKDFKVDSNKYLFKKLE